MSWLLLLLACSEPPVTDVEHYLASVASTSGGDAHRHCMLIADSDLRGECVASNAARQARAGHPERALSFCKAVAGPDAWEEECTFLVYDIVKPPFEEVVQRCAALDVHAQNCVVHAFSRDLANWKPPPGVTTESQLFQWLGDTLNNTWLTHPVTRNLPPQPTDVYNLVAAEVGRRLAPRVADGFTPEDCGDAPFDACSEAYRYWLHHHVDAATRRAFCDAHLTRSDTHRLGLPLFDESLRDQVSVAYTTICQDTLVPREGLPSEYGWEDEPL